MDDSKIDRTRLHEKLLLALAANRAPGFHFAGYFMQLAWPRVDARTILQTMTVCPDYADVHGNVHPAVLGVMIDGALASAPRLVIASGARQATVNLYVQYTGYPARGALEMEAILEGFCSEEAVRHALTRGVLTSDGRPVGYATGTFVLLPPPAGVKLAPTPFQRKGEPAPARLEPSELSTSERSVMRAAHEALERADAKHAFIEHFWGILPKRTATGATCRVQIGPQIGNRVGHVQGGILLGMAQATASAAVPHHPAISNISAWYISPGHGKTLNVRSRVLHAGRSFAVVRTEVRNADRTRVLEVVSNHAARHVEKRDA